MEETWESLFIAKAMELGHTDKYISMCLSYAQNLHANNVPVIFDTRHLAEYLNLSSNRLDKIFRERDHYYKEYDISKKSGGKRHLCVPLSTIKMIQTWIYKSILLPGYRHLDCVHGFVPKGNDGTVRGIYSNAMPHIKKTWVLNVDLKDFFDSVSSGIVYNIFRSLGYTDEVSMALMTLCVFNSKLPQGAPTSPILSNYAGYRMDLDFMELAKKFQCDYTRYADDITISGNGDIPPMEEIDHIVQSYGFERKISKTKLSKNGTKQEVTGLTVNKGVHVSKKYRHDVWQELYFCKKFGVMEHINHLNQRNNTTRGLYKQWLTGRIMFIRSIDKDCGNRMLDELNKLDWVL